MSKANFEKLESIYEGLFELPASEHESYLNKHCSENPQLRKEIEELLRFDSDDDLFIDSSPSSLAGSLLSSEHKLIGQKVGRFEIESLLGRGGMGEVFLARDSQLNRQIAIKFLSEDIEAKSAESNRFVKEAQAASKLNHPNIVTIHEINEFEGRPYIAMEFIEGLTLHEFRSKEEPTEDEAIRIGTQIASALQEAHSAGIVHRDIKSQNIMIRPDGLVKVLDFGIAKFTRPTAIESDVVSVSVASSGPTTNPSRTVDDTPVSMVSQTAPGVLIGTASYMSPEQVRGEEVTPQSDLFSLGVVLYEMLSGVLPFAGGTPIEIVGAILYKEPEDLKEHGVSERLSRIVDRCLAKDTDTRYSSAIELQKDLDESRNHQSERVRTSSSRTPFYRKLSKYLQPRFVVGLLLVFAFLTIIGIYQLFLSKQPIDSIAILPFVNDSGEASADHIADGMTETIIRSLSNDSRFSVRPRGTVFHYKGKDVSPQLVGAELGVEAVVKGKIVYDDNGRQLEVQLLNTSNQRRRWSKSYSLNDGNLLRSQNQIVSDIHAEILAESNQTTAQTFNYGTNDPVAFELYLRGRHHWNKRQKRNYEEAVKYFQKAIDRDPEFALAYVGLADSIAFLNLSEEIDFKKAKALAEKAIELDPTLGEAHTTLGLIIHETEQDWKEAERQYQTAIDLSPNYATTYQWYAELLIQMGDIQKAQTNFRKAAEIDPFSMPILTDYGFSYFYAGDSKKAIESLEETKKKDPSFYRSYIYQAMIYEFEGQLEESIEMNRKGLLLSNRDKKAVERISNELRKELKENGKEGYWKKRLEHYREIPELRTGWGTQLAVLYLRNGKEEDAFAEIERLISKKEFDVFYLKASPEFQSILNRKELRAILKRTNFPQ